MGIVFTVLIFEFILCVAAYVWAGRRGLASGIGHLLALDFGWLAGVWGRQATLRAVFPELKRIITNSDLRVENMVPACDDRLQTLIGGTYRNVVCMWQLMPDETMDLRYLDMNWWIGGVVGVLLIALPVIVFFWLSLLFIFGMGYTLPLNNISDRLNALWTIIGFVIGRNRPYYLATEAIIPDGQLTQTLEGKVVAGMTGPGVVLVNSHYATAMSDGPAYTRVGASRLILSRRKERPAQVVDLRPYVRPCPVQCTTQDGIEVKTVLPLIFKINPQDSGAPENNPDQRLYPFSEKAVLAAVHTQKGSEDKTHLWDDYLFDIARGIACDVFAQYRFDEVQGSAGREKVRKDIHDRINQAVGQPDAPGWCGIQVMFVAMSNVEAVNPQVTNWRIEEWRAPKAAQASKDRALGEAKAALTVAEAQAQAEGQLLSMLVDQLADAQAMGFDQASNTILLRAIQTTEQMMIQLPSGEQEDFRGVLSTIKRRITPEKKR